MKLFFLLLFLLLNIAPDAFSQEFYYWYGHKKIPLEVDSSFLYVEFENARSADIFLQTKPSIIDSKSINFYHYTPKNLVLSLKSEKVEQAKYREAKVLQGLKRLKFMVPPAS